MTGLMRTSNRGLLVQLHLDTTSAMGVPKTVLRTEDTEDTLHRSSFA